MRKFVFFWKAFRMLDLECAFKHKPTHKQKKSTTTPLRSVLLQKIKQTIFVVYFDQNLAAAHSKRWLEHAFLCFLHQKVEKEKNMENAAKWGAKCVFGLAPISWLRVLNMTSFTAVAMQPFITLILPLHFPTCIFYLIYTCATFPQFGILVRHYIVN